MISPESKWKEDGKRRQGSLRLLACLAFFLLVVMACTQPILAQEEVVEKEAGVLHTYSLEEIVIAALKQNALLRQAELQEGQAYARLLAEKGATELQGFATPILGVGSLERLEWAERAIDKPIRDDAADESAWEGGLRVGFRKPLPTGGLFSLGLDWGVVGGLDNTPRLGAEPYWADLHSEMTFRQPLRRDAKSLDPWWQILIAEDTYTKAKLAKDTARRNVLVMVTGMFFEAVKAQEQLDLALQTLESVQEHNRMVEGRVSRGLGGPLDLRTAEIEMATARHAVSQSRRQLDLARRQLSEATGLSLSGMTRLLPPPPITWDTTLDVATARALGNASELKAIEVDLDAARRAWRRAQGETKPKVDTSLSLNQDGAWRIGLEVTWSFWDGQAARQRAEAAALELQKLNTQLETMTEDMKLHIRREHYDYLTSDERVELAELRLARAEESLETTRRRYGLRMATELEMMNSLNQLREAKAEQAATSYDRTVAAIRLLAHTDQLIRVFPNMSWGQGELSEGSQP